MAQVLRSREARCGIEVLRTEDSVVMAILDSDCSIALLNHPTVWIDKGPQYKEGRKVINFDEEWRPLFRYGPTGIEPYPVLEATRKFIRGCYSEPTGFKGGALDALIDVLPEGEHHLFARGVGFIGRFASPEDAQMIAAALKADRPIIFGSPEEIMALADPDLSEVVSHLDPEYRWPTKFNINHAQGVFEMAKKTPKKKAKKVEKAEAAQRRADGPVAQARAVFDELHKANPETPSSEYIEKACAKGINRGTVTTQLGRWRKEKGIAVKRGGARKKGGAESAAKKDDKPSPKGKKGKKDKGDQKPGLPKSKAKGEKRHKPAKNDKSSASPAGNGAAASNPSPQTPQSQTPSSPASSASASSAGASGSTTAGTSGAAASPSAASAAPSTTGK